jgi:HD superfamily phosphohydrolase YqeK
MGKYHFKVVERLQRCHFNVKWATKPTVHTAQAGVAGLLFDIVKTGDIQKVITYMRE